MRLLDAQQAHWQDVWGSCPTFSANPSYSVQVAVTVFQDMGVREVLELGAGEGRDSLFFLQSGFDLHAMDYAEEALKQLSKKVKLQGLDGNLRLTQHDIRKPLPLPDHSIDACYSHMLYCMALTDDELKFLNREVLRVLKPGGVNILTVRNDKDPARGMGRHLGEMYYELEGGFIVRFFDDAAVEMLGNGYEVDDVEFFEEGDLPKQLTMLTLRKPIG